MDQIPDITLPNGATVPALGQGTWMMGERAADASREIESLRRGLDLGMTLIDTAEMYAEGGAEKIVAQAIDDRGPSVFLVSKVYPWNASRRGTIDACHRSLDRLRTDRIDLYLLHWRGEYPLGETVEAFERLREDGLIGGWGVSNFDKDDMEELLAVPGGENVQTNQILYNLTRRGPEFDLLPWCRARGIPVMAYSPIEQGALGRHPALAGLAAAKSTTPAQIALAFLLRRGDIIAIPKTSDPSRMAENRGSVAVSLDEAEIRRLDELFPPPQGKMPLEMI
jgi:diketogulonate reductase-like aldo/keto reductase